ncbi:helix-turn-helix transcriptional regulator [Brevibacterium samyangense]|uniref:HTH cro/C1-type domain-containing protein n=1 Tax=Brevibacterium samyangense TaxID=366888 RepID=A0ABP5ENC2_9MICO
MSIAHYFSEAGEKHSVPHANSEATSRFFTKLKRARMVARIPQNELADSMGVPVSDIDAIENGSPDVSVGTVIKYLDAIGAVFDVDVVPCWKKSA